MQFSPHSVAQRARVRSGTLRQHDVLRIEGEPALALASASAPPRLWGYLLDHTLRGFADGFARPHDGRIATRIHQGQRVAQQELRGRVDGLLDHRDADVALLALACEAGSLHVSVAGKLSVYVHGAQGLRQLTPQQPATDGLLKTDLVRCLEPVSSGDLVLAGSSALFNEPRLKRVQDACAADPRVAASQVAALLTAEDLGAVVVTFRVP